MKTLTLLRHAKSAWDDTVERDFDRPLNSRGRRAAVRMGQWLREHDARFDTVLASPALRVRQTIASVEDGLGRPLTPVFDARIYMASAATLLELVQAVDAGATALLVGHNPGIEDLLLLLTAPADPLRAEAEIKYPTATVAALTLPVAAWHDAVENCATLRDFVRPRDLDATLGPDD